MAEIKWIKITVNMFDDEKIKYIRTLPSGNDMVLFWVMLLTKAGKCNSNGYIFLTENIPYTPEILANEFDFELNTVKLALEVFQKLNMIEIEKTILIQNWGKHQNIEGMDKIREQNRIRAKEYRKRLAGVGGYSYLEHYDEIFKRDNGTCVYCGSKEDLCIDHLVPLIKGGDNEIDNLVISCKRCNSGKAGRLLEETRYDFHNKKTENQYVSVKARLNITQNVTQRHGTDIDIDIDKEVINKNARAREGYVEILDYFCNKANMFQPSANDILTAKKLIAESIPFEIIIYGIDECFKKYKPKYEGDKIRALSYCEGSIRKKHKIEQAKAVDIVGEIKPDTGTSTKYPDFDESKYFYKGDGE